MTPHSDEFLERIDTAFPQNRTHSTFFSIDGLCIGIHSESFVVLKNLTRALSHVLLSQRPDRIHLHIDVYSEKDQHFLSWLKKDREHELLRIQQKEYQCLFNPGIQNSFASLSFIHFGQKRALFWTANTELLPWYETAAPFRTIFHWFFQKQGYIFAHAACIGDQEKGLLIVGKGGKGKTSTALTSLITPNLYYLSDDYTLINMRSQPYAVSMYSTAKVDAHTQRCFPELKIEKQTVSLPNEEKSVYFVHQKKQNKIILKIPLVAIIIPEVVHAQQTYWEKVTPAVALLALAPSTLFQLHLEDTRNHTFLDQVKLTKLLTTFTLKLGLRPLEIGAKMVELLSQISPAESIR